MTATEKMISRLDNANRYQAEVTRNTITPKPVNYSFNSASDFNVFVNSKKSFYGINK